MDKEYQREYDLFVKGVSYAPEGSIPGYDVALETVKILTETVAS